MIFTLFEGDFHSIRVVFTLSTLLKSNHFTLFTLRENICWVEMITYPLRHDLKDSEYSNLKEKPGNIHYNWIEQWYYPLIIFFLLNNGYLLGMPRQQEVKWPALAFLLQFLSHFTVTITQNHAIKNVIIQNLRTINMTNVSEVTIWHCMADSTLCIPTMPTPIQAHLWTPIPGGGGG